MQAIEAAVRFYEEPPDRGDDGRDRLGRHLAERRRLGRGVRRAPSPARRTTRRASRSGTSCSRSWSTSTTATTSPADQLPQRRCGRTASCARRFNRAWPLLEAADLVGDLWSVPAYLRKCAPWLGPDDVRALQRADAAGLDGVRPAAARRRPAAARRPGGVAAPAPARGRGRRRARADGPGRRRPDRGRRRRDGSADVDAARRGPRRTPWSTRPRCPSADPDLLAGPFAHIVVDEAQELTDAEWQMLLLRCPSRSFTIVGDRAQARHGFTESWQERLERIGLDRIELASLSINYRTPEEVMAEAEPVIRAVLPDANVPTSIRSSGVPVVHGPAAELDSILDAWLADARRRDRLRHRRRRRSRPTAAGPVADPGAGQGARVRPGRPGRSGGVRRRASRERSTATSR